MPDSFTVAEVTDRGLAVVPDAFARLDAPDVGSRGDVTDLVRDAFATAVIDTDRSGALVAAIAAAQAPVDLATTLINDKYAAMGGAGGPLGPTTGPVTACVDRFGFKRLFRQGTIIWHPVTGVHEVLGPINAKWATLGSEQGFLGYPTSDQRPGSDPEQIGVFGRFQGGAIHWHPELTLTAGALDSSPATLGTLAERPAVTVVNDAGVTAGRLMTKVAAIGASDALTVIGAPSAVLDSARGAFEVHGDIGAHYRALGGSGSFLGYPTTDETATPDGVGRFNHFQAGSIYWTPSTGAHEVHGLIRQLWAQRGWERDAALGYPISDELIPDRRIGHRRPELKRKPIALPADVIKLPAEAVHAGFSSLISNVGAEPVRRATSTPGPVASLNRYGDFESGVLFWRRGASTAQQLQPWMQSSDGTSMHRSAAEVIAAIGPMLRQALNRLTGASLGALSFNGTTGYRFDGANVHNRRHRVIAQLMTSQHLGLPLGGSVDVPMVVGAELQLEAAFEPVERQATVCLAGWSFALPAAVSASPPLDRQLHQLLDPLLFASVGLIGLPDTDGGMPIAVLSVKTTVDGTVCMFVEPGAPSIVDGLVSDHISAAVLPRARGVTH